MKRKDLAYKNLALGVEFDKYLVEHPEILDKIPNKSTVVLLPEYDRELYESNIKLAQKRTNENGVRQTLLIFSVCALFLKCHRYSLSPFVVHDPSPVHSLAFPTPGLMPPDLAPTPRPFPDW